MDNDSSNNRSKFAKNVAPIKLTEGRRLKLHTKGWGILSDYYLESVKIEKKSGVLTTTATIRVGDRSGQITCVLRGPKVGFLFGLSVDQWKNIEMLFNGKQLFYRYFKNGICNSFSFHEKLFYNFCVSNQRESMWVVMFRRCINMRSKDKNDAFLDIVDIWTCDNYYLDLYSDHLREMIKNVNC